MRRKGPRAVSFALDGLADRLEPPTVLAAVQRAWPRCAGMFASTTEPVSESDGVVVVACDASTIAQELELMSELVIERLNAELGRPAVKRLRTRATRT
jgi:predicted nucleic acid-binding Zn ribbon protein